MRRPPAVSLPLALVLSCLATVARAATPITLPTSGFLIDAADRPVTRRAAPISFSLWSDPGSNDAAARVWPANGESACVADVSEGYYAVLLDGTDGSSCGAGLTTDQLPSGQARWLQVSVEGTTLLPRIRVSAVPTSTIAARALDADLVGGESPASLHDASKLTGTVPASALGAGSTGITTLGTIATGTWRAAPVADAYVASAASWNAKLAAVARDGTLVGNGTSTSPLGANVGTTAGTLAAGDDVRFGRWTGTATGLDAATARTSLGLGTAALSATSAFATAAQGVKADDALARAGGTITGAVAFPGSGAWAANGNVGIGSASPAYKLDVAGEARVTRLTLGDSGAISASVNDAVGTPEYPYRYTITVPGDAYTFYPVAFLNAGNGIPPGKIVIARAYWETGPVAPAPDASHIAGLQAVFTTNNVAWADYNYLTLVQYRWTYVRTIADCGNLPSATSGRALWCRLRGGGYVYKIWSNYPLDPAQPVPGSVAYNTPPYNFTYPGTLAAASLPANAFAPGASIVPVAAY